MSKIKLDLILGIILILVLFSQAKTTFAQNLASTPCNDDPFEYRLVAHGWHHGPGPGGPPPPPGPGFGPRHYGPPPPMHYGPRPYGGPPPPMYYDPRPRGGTLIDGARGHGPQGFRGPHHYPGPHHHPGPHRRPW